MLLLSGFLGSFANFLSSTDLSSRKALRMSFSSSSEILSMPSRYLASQPVSLARLVIFFLRSSCWYFSVFRTMAFSVNDERVISLLSTKIEGE